MEPTCRSASFDRVIIEQVVGMPFACIPSTPERPGHLAVIDAYLYKRGMHPNGRFGDWKYVNQDGAIATAKRVVESVQAGATTRTAATSSSFREDVTARPVATT